MVRLSFLILQQMHRTLIKTSGESQRDRKKLDLYNKINDEELIKIPYNVVI